MRKYLAQEVHSLLAMSFPRQVLPGATVLVTRRCTQRQFLLKPSALRNQILLYCLGIAAERYKIQLHAFCFLSNHIHLVLTDPHGHQPEFSRWFHEFTAKCINASLGRWENLWSCEPTSVVQLVGERAQIEKMIYTWTNPVSSGLVKYSHSWPGAHSRPSDLGKDFVIQRPRIFFRPDGPMPEKVLLRLKKIPALKHLSREDYIKYLDRAISDREQELHREMKGSDRPFFGRRAVRDQSPFSRPASHEPRRKMSPRLACRNKWGRIEALSRMKEFIKHYREAWSKFKAGEQGVLFPHGTYWLRIYAGVKCVPG